MAVGNGAWGAQQRLLLVLLMAMACGVAEGAFRVPATCRADEVFDTAGVTCAPCPADASPDLEVRQGGYKTLCSCDAGRRTVYSGPAIDEPLDFGTCQACPEGSVPSKGGKYCVQCDASQGTDWTAARVNADGTACECATPTASSIITELGVGGALLTGAGNSTFLQRCVMCPPGTQPDAAAMRCASCPYPKQWNGQRCICPTQLPEGARCSLTEEAWQDILERGSVNFDVTFDDVRTADGAEFGRQIVVENSAVLVDRLEVAASGCFEAGDRRACNELANLCVLQMHDVDASACVLYQELVDMRSDEQYHETTLDDAGWSVSLPWLYYSGDATRYLRATDVSTRVKFEGDNVGGNTPSASVLQFKMARYALDGEFLGWRNFTRDFQLCGGQLKHTNSWAHFAVEYRNKCELPLNFILDLGLGQPEFVDLYFEDGPDRLYPVPFILENIPDNNREVEEMAFLQLTRRFFMVDPVSGIEDGASTPAAIRYLEKFSMEVTLQASTTQGNEGRIYPPAVRIRYGARDPSIRGAGVVNTAEFSVHYSQSEQRLEDFIDAWDYMIIAAMMGAVVVGMAKIYRFTKNQGSGSGQNGGELMVLVEFIAIVADVGSGALFAVLTAICIYWVCFFKLQSGVYTLLPLDEGEVWYRFRVSVICTVVGRATTVLWMLWRQTSMDIFFIDWTEAKDRVNDKDGVVEKAPVSCWRSLFVANAWNELQTLRVTNLEVTMFLMVFLLSGLQLENGAKINPDIDSLDINPFEETSQLLRFGISTSLFILVEIAQVLFVKLVVYYKIANPLVDFVDLLWLSNISVVILDRCSGYYLHGQFTGTYVDTDAEELNEVLLRPHNDNRGFVEGDECQTFILFITSSLRDTYDNFLNSVSSKYNRQRENDGNINYALYGPKGAGTDKNLQQDSQRLRERFQTELLTAQREPHVHVSDPGLLAKWTMLAPDNANGKTLFWKDRMMAFSNVLFYGNELSLFMLQVMMFTSIDMRLRNAAFSGPITYLIMWVLNYIRHQWGENNLSQKSLVDKKFLI